MMRRFLRWLLRDRIAEVMASHDDAEKFIETRASQRWL